MSARGKAGQVASDATTPGVEGTKKRTFRFYSHTRGTTLTHLLASTVSSSFNLEKLSHVIETNVLPFFLMQVPTTEAWTFGYLSKARSPEPSQRACMSSCIHHKPLRGTFTDSALHVLTSSSVSFGKLSHVTSLGLVGLLPLLRRCSIGTRSTSMSSSIILACTVSRTRLF